MKRRSPWWPRAARAGRWNSRFLLMVRRSMPPLRAGARCRCRPIPPASASWTRVDPEPPRRRPLAQTLDPDRMPDLQIEFHALHPQPSAESRQKPIHWRSFTPAQPDHLAASVTDYCSGAYIRHLIAGKLAETFPEHGAFEVDESYFGGARKGKRGRGAAGKVPVFGILKRGGKVYTKMIADASSKTLLKAIKSQILPDSIVYTDSFGSYGVLDVSEFKHRRVNHSKTGVSEVLCRGAHTQVASGAAYVLARQEPAAMMQGDSFAVIPTMVLRCIRRRKMTRPDASRPTTLQLFFPRSISRTAISMDGLLDLN